MGETLLPIPDTGEQAEGLDLAWVLGPRGGSAIPFLPRSPRRSGDGVPPHREERVEWGSPTWAATGEAGRGTTTFSKLVPGEGEVPGREQHVLSLPLIHVHIKAENS